MNQSYCVWFHLRPIKQQIKFLITSANHKRCENDAWLFFLFVFVFSLKYSKMSFECILWFAVSFCWFKSIYRVHVGSCVRLRPGQSNSISWGNWVDNWYKTLNEALVCRLALLCICKFVEKTKVYIMVNFRLFLPNYMCLSAYLNLWLLSIKFWRIWLIR